MDTQFHWADYLVFGIMLLFSVAIGILYAIKDRKLTGNKTEDFFVAGRKMSVLPVSVSIYVSYLSAVSFLGKFVVLLDILFDYIHRTYLFAVLCLGSPLG